MAELVPIGGALLSLLPSALNLSINAFNKIGFDLDVTGRQREILRIEEALRTEHANKGIKMNITVWNMHVPMEHHFDDVQLQALSPMGKGGGFEIRVFSGKGYMKNGGHGGNDNWKWSGNCKQMENIVSCRPVDWSSWTKAVEI